MGRVAVVGVYLIDKPSLVCEISREMACSRHWEVEQRWAALGEGTVAERLAPITAGQWRGSAGKFALLNSILAGWGRFEESDYLVVCDDDVTLPQGFLDQYLEIVERFGFALSQPARSHDSFIDHHFVERLDGLTARQTRFVEIGPLFVVHRLAYPHLIPFDEFAPMGWGLDFVWPLRLERAGLTLGIVDAIPVAHSIRPPVAFYLHRDADRGMKLYLTRHEHLAKGEAFSIVESYV